MAAAADSRNGPNSKGTGNILSKHKTTQSKRLKDVFSVAQFCCTTTVIIVERMQVFDLYI